MKIESYEDSSLGAYLNSLDEQDIYQMAVNGEYSELCKLSEKLFRVIPPACVEAFEALLWTAAETIINSRVDEDGQ